MFRSILLISAACLVAGYAVQIATPLRLNNDAVTLLGMAMSASEGHGFTTTRFPVGYPLFVVGLEKLGLATSAGFVTANLIFLGLALGASNSLLVRRLSLSPDVAAAIGLVAAGSWVAIKYVSVPVTEFAFFGASMLALMFTADAEASSGRTRWARLCAAGLLGVAAISVRTVGIALVPALIWAGGGHEFAVWMGKRPSISAWVTAAVIGALAIGCYGIVQTRYFSQFLAAADSQSIEGMLARNFSWRLQEFGELVLNVPASMTAGRFRPVYLAAGMATLAAFLIGLWPRRASLQSPEIFMIAYAAIIFLWPYYGPRFWLPVLPLFLAYVWLGARWISERIRLPRPAAVALVAAQIGIYAALAAVALFYSTRISLAGAEFPERYGHGSLLETYRAALGQPHNDRQVNRKALILLERYDNRLKQIGARDSTGDR